MNTATAAAAALRRLAKREKIPLLMRYFKTGPGEYGNGDTFIGVSVPENRSVARRFADLPLEQLQLLLHSRIHEERQLALFILVRQYEKTKTSAMREKVFRFYLKNRKHVNNWDLVDSSAMQIVGAHLLPAKNGSVSAKGRKLLKKLAQSRNVWDRRIAVLSTFQFIRHHHWKETLCIARLLLEDEHDLIQKAVGWMLREIGKRDQEVEEKFLNQHLARMPRTMLRYAIERFSVQKRRNYLKKPVTNSRC